MEITVMTDISSAALTGGGNGIPPGARKTIHKRCGIPVLSARLHPEVAARRGRRTVILLEPLPRPGRGAVALTRRGAVFTGKVPADWALHRCPAKITRCKFCGEPVRVLLQGPDAPEQLAVVEAEADPRGPVVIDRNGHAVPDPVGATAGERFRWHTRHGRAETVRMMSEVPGGQR
jgi:hypothetical protein